MILKNSTREGLYKLLSLPHIKQYMPHMQVNPSVDLPKGSNLWICFVFWFSSVFFIYIAKGVEYINLSHIVYIPYILCIYLLIYIIILIKEYTIIYMLYYICYTYYY